MPIPVKLDVEFPKTPLFEPGGADAIIRIEILRFLRDALTLGHKIADRVTPLGATANLLGSIVERQTDTGPINYAGELVWTAPYAETVARGGPPRHVNLGKLQLWAGFVLADEGAAPAIQAAIARQGTPSPRHPNPGLNMDTKLITRWTPIVCRLIEQACHRIAQRMNP